MIELRSVPDIMKLAANVRQVIVVSDAVLKSANFGVTPSICGKLLLLVPFPAQKRHTKPRDQGH